MSYSVGDMFYADTVNTLALLHITGVGKILGVVNGKPAWIDPIAQVNSDWNSISGISQILNKPSFATVATSGSYNDLSNKPTIPSSQVNSDWNANSGIAQILNKPVNSFSIPTFSSCTTSAQLSATRSAQVYYNFPTSISSILGSLSVTATLQFADDMSFTVNVVNLNSDSQGCSGLLNLTLVGRLQVQGIIPPGKYRRVIFSQAGGVTIPTTLSSGQEILI